MTRRDIRLPESGEGVWKSPIEAADGQDAPAGAGFGSLSSRGGIRLPGPGEGIWSEPLDYEPEPETPPARALDGVLAMAKEAREAARIGRAAARTTATLAERMAAIEEDPARDAGDLLPEFEAAAAQLHREQGQGFEGLAKQVYDTRMAEAVERARQRAEQAVLRKTVSQNRALLDETLDDLGRLAVEGGPEDRDHYARQAEAAIRAQLAGGIIDEDGAAAAWERFARPTAPLSNSDLAADPEPDEGRSLAMAEDVRERPAAVAEGNAGGDPPSPDGAERRKSEPIPGTPLPRNDGERRQRCRTLSMMLNADRSARDAKHQEALAASERLRALKSELEDKEMHAGIELTAKLIGRAVQAARDRNPIGIVLRESLRRVGADLLSSRIKFDGADETRGKVEGAVTAINAALDEAARLDGKIEETLADSEYHGCGLP